MERALKNSTTKSNLLADPVGSVLYRTTVPTTIGALAVILYYLVDSFFVSLLGIGELAALGFTFPATILFTYFGVGLGIGTSALVAGALGSGNRAQACELTFASLLAGLLLGLLFMAPALATIDQVFPLLGASPESMALIHDFMQFWYLGLPFQLMQFAGTAAIRASGNASLHGKLMVAGAAINAVLDPLFIFGLGPIPAMGIGGAALATTLSYLITVVIICYQLCRKEQLLSFCLPRFQALLATWRRLLGITAPAALANMITPIATAILTATLALYGTQAVAAYGVVSRVESFIMIVVLGMSMSVPPFISQNYGAHHYHRVLLGLRLSLNFVLVLQLCLYLVVALTAPWIAAIFTRDAEVQSLITLILRILPLSYAFQGMVLLSASSFTALHAPRNALITRLLRFLVFYVPFALLGNAIAGIEGLFIGAALGNLCSGLPLRLWIFRYTRALLCDQQPAPQSAGKP